MVGDDKKVPLVLFVDDEVNILSSIRRAVIDEEYTAYFAGSAAEALHIMGKYEISVIVSDMKMPVMDGLQLLKIVKETYPNTVRIVLSGYTQLSQVLATVNQADIFSFIAKPWNMETELKYVINRGIEHYQLKMTEVKLKEQLQTRNTSYQNVLKKMDKTANERKQQMQYIKAINSLLLDAIERQSKYESKYLAMFMNDYIEMLPSCAMNDFDLEELVATLQSLVGEIPRYSKVKVNINSTAVGKVTGCSEVIVFAVTCLLKFLPQFTAKEELYIHFVTKDTEDKAIVSCSIVLLDSVGVFQNPLTKPLQQLTIKLVREIMDGKLVVYRKDDKQAIQLEFTLDKVL